MEEGKNVNAVTVINGNISTPFKIQRGCRQGDHISGYLFILAIEILALFLKQSKINPYTTKHGIKHLFDIYADDLTIYMNRHKSDNKKNQENVKNALEVIEMFFDWSGLKINRGKTYLSMFGASLGCPRFVNTLVVKWSMELKLLGLKFDQCFDKMNDITMTVLTKSKKN